MITQILNNVVNAVGKQEKKVYIAKNDKNEIVEVHFSDYFIADYYKDKITKDVVIVYEDHVDKSYGVYVTPFALNKGVYDPKNLIATVSIDGRFVQFYKLTDESGNDYHYAKSGNTLLFLGWYTSEHGDLVLTPSFSPERSYEINMEIPVEETENQRFALCI